MIDFSCRDCKFYYEDEDRHKCMKGHKGVHYNGCREWDDGSGINYDALTGETQEE